MWVRPAPYVQLGGQFRGLTLLSSQSRGQNSNALFNTGEKVVDNAVYRLSISPSIPEALKFESCPKSRPILDVLRYPKF